MDKPMVRITISLPVEDLNVVRRVVRDTKGTTLAGIIRGSLVRESRRLAARHDISQSPRRVRLRAGRPRLR